MFEMNLAKTREEKGLTKEELGRMIGISKMTIEKWENGSSYPSFIALIMLCRVLEVSPEYLYGTDIPFIDMKNLPKEIEFQTKFYIDYLRKKNNKKSF